MKNDEFVVQVFDGDYEETKFRSVSLEALGPNENAGGINRIKTLRCYPAKVPELIKNCCDYLEKNGTETLTFDPKRFSPGGKFFRIADSGIIPSWCLEKAIERSKYLFE